MALAWAGDQDQASRFRMDGVESLDGRDGGLAPLASAVQDAALGGAFQDFHLAGIGVEAELLAGEVQDACGTFRFPNDGLGAG